MTTAMSGDFGNAWQRGAVDDVLWQEDVDDLMNELQREAPHLLFGLDGSAPPPAAIGFPTFVSNGFDNLTISPQQTLQQPTSPIDDLSLKRSNSKRPRGGDDEAHDHKGKRNRKVANGFPCGEEGCEKSFDRACDLTKHHKRVHTSKEDRPHQCPQCECRFCWPKDVKRHLGQVHGIHTEQTPSLPMRGGPTHALSLVIKQEPRDHKSMNMNNFEIPTSPTAKSSTMAWLTKSLVMLKKLRLRSKSTDESDVEDNYIFVTQDKRNFQMVDLNGVSSPDSLIQQIASSMNLQGQTQSSNFLLHRFRRGSKLGEQLAGDNLMAAVSKAERAKRTLRLFLTLKSTTTQPPSSFFGGLSPTTSPVSFFK